MISIIFFGHNSDHGVESREDVGKLIRKVSGIT